MKGHSDNVIKECQLEIIMEDIRYLIIFNINNKLGDKRLFEILRQYDNEFITGTCCDYESPCNNKCCIWYLTNKNSCVTSLDLTDFVGGDYKIMSTDERFFECNCADVDLPMIESVWEIIKRKI